MSRELTESEREILREHEANDFGTRKPFESNRQATYEDHAPAPFEWDEDQA
jgi:hypothetical protein